jgi:hypothetical protein
LCGVQADLIGDASDTLRRSYARADGATAARVFADLIEEIFPNMPLADAAVGQCAERSLNPKAVARPAVYAGGPFAPSWAARRAEGAAAAGSILVGGDPDGCNQPSLRPMGVDAHHSSAIVAREVGIGAHLAQMPVTDLIRRERPQSARAAQPMPGRCRPGHETGAMQAECQTDLGRLASVRDWPAIVQEPSGQGGRPPRRGHRRRARRASRKGGKRAFAAAVDNVFRGPNPGGAASKMWTIKSHQITYI